MAKAPVDYGFAAWYEPPEGGIDAYIVDIDGTFMLRGKRGIHDYHRVSEDAPAMQVVSVVHDMQKAGNSILFLSGRPDSCEEATRASIEACDFTDYKLWMRTTGDYRPDYIVKLEIFNREIRNTYNVKACFDDRLQVVYLWREMGLLCLDVAGGDF